MPTRPPAAEQPPVISDSDIEGAFEAITEQPPASGVQQATEARPDAPEIKQARVGEVANRFAGEAVGLLKADKGEGKQGLATLKDRFLQEARQTVPDITNGEAMDSLRAYLKSQHDAHFSLDETLAGDIDAFARSLEFEAKVESKSAKAFLTMLNSDSYETMEDAMNGLDEYKRQATAADMGADEMNSEFNALYQMAQRHFGGESRGEKGALEASDEDIEGALNQLG
ncbi:MAG: hypothetical protein PHT12_03530 [Patescibacteria group bacterium]|nr:hypothetical protein [Patescibacteria group bacterium]